MGKLTIDYSRIAAELKTTRLKLQNFVKWYQRNRDQQAFQPDGLGIATRTLKHTFTRRTADAIKRAYVAQRITRKKRSQPQ